MEEERTGKLHFVQSSIGGDLGDFKFDEDLARELGKTIVKYSVVIQKLIEQFQSSKGFPGLCNNNTKDTQGQLFVFRGSHFVRYIRKETNEIKHLLYAYKIEV